MCICLLFVVFLHRGIRLDFVLALMSNLFIYLFFRTAARSPLSLPPCASPTTQLCSLGRYAPSTGMTTCFPCGSGSAAGSAGSRECTQYVNRACVCVDVCAVHVRSAVRKLLRVTLLLPCFDACVSSGFLWGDVAACSSLHRCPVGKFADQQGLDKCADCKVLFARLFFASCALLLSCRLKG